ncbi:hypothetical protein L0U85_10545 [Glycomyces sp. L485]|uniref:hypothetical protein n=1 Tax=Glycomyces sp. L485 TaxID=2909235 RepID=UPI001F4B1D1F|nr:hypothetical protein [Glycomyces sp. L485]MCH7231285.1 hypothetical protein [Glycomyces sp. L485]
MNMRTSIEGASPSSRLTRLRAVDQYLVSTALVGGAMFRIEWTAHEPKPQAEIDELYSELLESIEIDGPYEFSTLVCAAQLLETRYVVARIIGYSDCEPTLDYTDIVDLFESMDAALGALEEHRTGVLEFYPASSESIAFDASHDQVRLFRVPWLEANGIDIKSPLPHHLTARPEAVCERSVLADHLRDLRREFAQAAIKSDPRLAAHEPLRRWSLNESGST